MNFSGIMGMICGMTISLIMILTLAAMLMGADILVKGLSDIARRLRVSDVIISVIIIGVGTSLPELMITLSSGAQDLGDLAVSNVVGSNITNILLILGIGLLIKPMRVNFKEFKPEIIAVFIAEIALTILIMLGQITFFEGAVLLIVALAYSYISFKHHGNAVRAKIRYSKIGASFYVIAGLFLLAIGSEYFMQAINRLITEYHISESKLGILIVAPGTSMPELVVTIVAALRRNPKIALGNLIGSNLMNILFVLGAGGIAHNLIIHDKSLLSSAFNMIGAMVALIIPMIIWKRLGRLCGVAFIAMYVAYVLFMMLIMHIAINLDTRVARAFAAFARV
jgi:cation:H+ antiporter